MKIVTEYFSENESVSLTAYLLDNSAEMPNMALRPAMLVIPGGSYRFCSDREAEPIAMLFAKEGYQTFVLRYSCGERGTDYNFETPFADAKRAIKHIRDNADSYRIDKNKVAVIGFSAGGHLASALATIGEDKPNALLLGYPCILSSSSSVCACDFPSTSDFVSAQTPPTFIFSTCNDKTVPIENTIAFADALDKNNVPFEVHIFAEGRHGASLATPSVCVDGGNADFAQWQDLSIKWLRKYF